MSMNEIEAKCRGLRQLQALIDEAQQEAEAIKDAIKAHMGDSEELSAPVIKCKKTPRKKCSFMAEEAKKR